MLTAPSQKVFRRKVSRSALVAFYVATLPISLPVILFVYKKRGKSLRDHLTSSTFWAALSGRKKPLGQNRINALKNYLWYGCEAAATKEIYNQLSLLPKNSDEYIDLSEGLASRLDFMGSQREALTLIKNIEMSSLSSGSLAKVATLNVLLKQRNLKFGSAEALLKKYPRLSDSPNFILAHSNDCIDFESKIAALNILYKRRGLASLNAKEHCVNTPFFALRADRVDEAAFDVGKVSVIFPVYNAEDSIVIAIKSVLSQTYKNIEVVVIDDCSTDKTFQNAKDLERNDSRVKVLKLSRNSGAYVARNFGLSVSTGDFITTHDSDDWSHPQKIELQLKPFLLRPFLVATGSHWVRCDQNFRFCNWCLRESIIHFSYPSFLVRRKVFEKIGRWDEVRISGDAEFINRLSRNYGDSSIEWVLPDVPLAIALADEKSLTGTKATHVSSTRLGLRYYYHQAFKYQNFLGSGNEGSRQEERRRLVPRELLHKANGEVQNYSIIVIADYRYTEMVNWAAKIVAGHSGRVGLAHRPEFVLKQGVSFSLTPEFFELLKKEAIEIVNEPASVFCDVRHYLLLNGEVSTLINGE